MICLLNIPSLSSTLLEEGEEKPLSFHWSKVRSLAVFLAGLVAPAAFAFSFSSLILARRLIFLSFSRRRNRTALLCTRSVMKEVVFVVVKFQLKKQ